MPVNFPNSPALNDTFELNGRVYTWDGEKWTSTLQLLPEKATQGDAELGVDNDKFMTALRTAQAIDAQVSPTAWAELIGDLTDEQADAARIILQSQKKENGFDNRTDSTISFDNATRTFTIAPSTSSYRFVSTGNTYTKTSPETLQISDVEGLHFIYFDGETLVETTNFSINIIVDYAFVAVLYWNATDQNTIIFQDERHGNVMDSATHVYNHVTFGTRYQDGLGLTGIQPDGNGGPAGDVQFGVNGGSIWDEDIQHTIINFQPQKLSYPARIPVFYRVGTNGDWRRGPTNSNFPVMTTGTGRLAYNNFTGSEWQMTEVSNNSYVLYHYFATGDVNHPIIGIMGQSQYGSLSNAQAAARVEINDLNKGQLDILNPEYFAIATVIFETRDNYSNAVKARIRSTDGGESYIDWRTSISGSGSSGSSATSWGDITGTITAQTDLMSTFLAKDNTTAFTPTQDYHPATKLYVDNSGTSVAGLTGNIQYNDSGALAGSNDFNITFDVPSIANGISTVLKLGDGIIDQTIETVFAPEGQMNFKPTGDDYPKFSVQKQVDGSETDFRFQIQSNDADQWCVLESGRSPGLKIQTFVGAITGISEPPILLSPGQVERVRIGYNQVDFQIPIDMGGNVIKNHLVDSYFVNSATLLIDSNYESGSVIRLVGNDARTITLGDAPEGFQALFVQIDTGTQTFEADTGQTMLSVGNANTIANQYGLVSVIKISPTVWLISGDLE